MQQPYRTNRLPAFLLLAWLLLVSGCAMTSNGAGASVPGQWNAQTGPDHLMALVHVPLNPHLYITTVDGSDRPMGFVTSIRLSEGKHVIAFTAHPMLLRLVPTDPDEKISLFGPGIRHWITFTAHAGHTYDVVHRTGASSSFRMDIVDRVGGVVASIPIGNYQVPPAPRVQEADKPPPASSASGGKLSLDDLDALLPKTP